MGVHCYLTELGTLVTMAVKIVAVVVTLASLAAAEPGYGGAYHPYGGHSYTYRTTQGLTGYHGYYGYGKREAEPGYGYVVLHSMPMEAIVIHIEVHKVSMDTTDMDMSMVRGLLMLDMAMAMDMELPLSMSPRLTMDMATTLPITTMVTVFTRGLQMLSQDMVTLSVILIEVHKDSMDTMVGMDMDMDTMDMARDLLSQVIMVMPALLSTKAVLTTMDPTDMVSSIMARDLLMLDIMDTMDMVVLVISKLTDLTLTMVSVWHILTKCDVRGPVEILQ